MLKPVLERILAHQDLSEHETESVLSDILAGNVSDTEVGGFLMALRMKGLSRSELTGAARAVRRHATRIDTGCLDTVDIVGTGGDGGRSFNISTTAAFIAAGAGVSMAKHGNRAMSGKCGSADVLVASGFNLDVSATRMERSICEDGLGFLFAQKMHPILAKVAPIRKALGVYTLFNLIGPLCNPANATAMVVGVYDAALTELVAGSLHDLGVKRAMVVHGEDGLDEITVTGATRITEVDEAGMIRTYELYPELLFGQRASLSAITGGSPHDNAQLLRAILDGSQRGASRDVAVINAAAALTVAGLASEITDAIPLAEESIDSGRALEKFTHLIETSNEH